MNHTRACLVLGVVLGLACAGAPRKVEVHPPSAPVAGLAQGEPQPGWQPELPGSKDSDGDGVADNLDLCPNDPEDRDGFEDNDGCPDPDNDQDRIPDVDDKCPNEPETYNGFEDEDGCPDRGHIHMGTGHDIDVAPLAFDRGQAAPKAGFESTLNDLVSTMDRFPQILLIEVQGHASADERHAEALSMARAVAVRDAIIKRGVSADRLLARGYGTKASVYCPTSSLGCEPVEVRRMNRRVTFKLLKWSDATTGEGR